MDNLKDNKDRVWRKIIIFLSKESNKKKQVLKKKNQIVVGEWEKFIFSKNLSFIGQKK